VTREGRGRSRSRKACCMISEVLEETGIDRARLRRARRQVLEGIILLCRWQLQRMEEDEPTTTRSGPRKVEVE
jgi:hypothetical protein